MIRRKHRLLALLLTVMMLFGMATVAMVSTSAAAGDTVFCDNAANWGTVYCYMWSDSLGNNAEWPGVQMTKGSDGLWSYSITKDWNMIIFNNGQGTQTGDLSYQGNGSCFNNSTGGWSTVDVPTNPTTPDPTTPTTPTTPTPNPSGTNVVYCQNDANWGSVSVYMWNSDSDENSSWPGQTATHLGDGLWMLEYSKEYANIIFNNGGSSQTSDLTHPGTGMCYNNATGQWSLYDTSKLHIKSFGADIAGPQYTGVDITLSMEAGGGEGDLSYKFTANNTVISDFSADNEVVWTPTTAGNYTLSFIVKDANGETLTKTLSYTIKDIASEVSPVIQTVAVTPGNADKKEIQKGVEATVDITAGGGNIETKLLFYKVKITDPNGNTANVPYYTLNDQYKFTPTVLGTYEIAVSVQNAKNTTVTKTYEYECVGEVTPADKLSASVSVSGDKTVGSTVTVTATAEGGSAPYKYQFSVNDSVVKAYSTSNSYALSLTEEGTYAVSVSVKDNDGTVVTKSTTITATGGNVPGPVGLKGDADCSGVVNVKDATAVQKHVASIITLSEQGLANGEVDGSGSLTVKDATMIQKYVAGMDVNW